MDFIKRLVVEEEGTEAAEWALMVVVLALAIIFGGDGLKTSLGNALTSVGAGVDAQVDGALPNG